MTPVEKTNLTLANLIDSFESEPGEPVGPEWKPRWWILEDIAWVVAEQGPEGLAYLMTALNGDDAERVAAAVLGLSIQGFGDSAIVARLCDLLDDDRREVLVAAIDALAHLRAGEADAAMRRLRAHPDPYVRGRVIAYLIRMHPESATRLAEGAVQDDHFVVRLSAIDAIDDLAIDKELDLADSWHLIWPAIADPDPSVRLFAHGTLNRHFWTRPRSQLKRARRSRDSFRRASAYWTAIDDDFFGPSRELFLQGLRDPHWLVRVAVLDRTYAAGSARKELPDLRPFLNDSDPRVCDAARYAMQERGELPWDDE